MSFKSQPLTLIVPTLDIGGAERVFILLANQLAKNDINSVVLRPISSAGAMKSRLDEKVRLAPFCTNPSLPFIIALIFALPALIRSLRNEKTTILATLTGMNLLLLILGFMCRRRARLFIREACTLSNVSSGFRIFLMKRCYSMADGVIAVSEEVKQDLLQKISLSDVPITVINNPIDTIVSKSSLTDPDSFFLKKVQPFIVSVGRLSYQKGFDLLLEAYARSPINEAFNLVVIGDGAERRRLEQQATTLGIEKKVHFVGFKEQPRQWMIKSKLFVLSSRFEGFCNTLLEAMECGLPIVSTDCPGGPRLMLEGSRGALLVSIGVNEIEAGLTAFYKGQAPFDSGPPRYNLRRFNVESIASKYESFICY
jgi:glycosyltransferase involved in cell wall biosynthesis